MSKNINISDYRHRCTLEDVINLISLKSSNFNELKKFKRLLEGVDDISQINDAIDRLAEVRSEV